MTAADLVIATLLAAPEPLTPSAISLATGLKLTTVYTTLRRVRDDLTSESAATDRPGGQPKAWMIRPGARLRLSVGLAQLRDSVSQLAATDDPPELAALHHELAVRSTQALPGDKAGLVARGRMVLSRLRRMETDERTALWVEVLTFLTDLLEAELLSAEGRDPVMLDDRLWELEERLKASGEDDLAYALIRRRLQSALGDFARKGALPNLSADMEEERSTHPETLDQVMTRFPSARKVYGLEKVQKAVDAHLRNPYFTATTGS